VKDPFQVNELLVLLSFSTLVVGGGNFPNVLYVLLSGPFSRPYFSPEIRHQLQPYICMRNGLNYSYRSRQRLRRA
jgi:hypothetical protein